MIQRTASDDCANLPATCNVSEDTVNSLFHTELHVCPKNLCLFQNTGNVKLRGRLSGCKTTEETRELYQFDNDFLHRKWQRERKDF